MRSLPGNIQRRSGLRRAWLKLLIFLVLYRPKRYEAHVAKSHHSRHCGGQSRIIGFSALVVTDENDRVAGVVQLLALLRAGIV